MQLQKQELAKHSTCVHNTGEPSTTTDVAVDLTTVKYNEYGDAAAATAYKAAHSSSSYRSKKKPKNCAKSLRSDMHWSGVIYDDNGMHVGAMLC